MKQFPKLLDFFDEAKEFLEWGFYLKRKYTFAPDVRKDILKGLDGTNDQKDFDGIKQLLNTLDYSKLKKIELIGKEYPKGSRKGAEFEESRDLTTFYKDSIEVRNEIYNIMKLGGLKNNYPKNAFLCPYELEDVHEEDEFKKQAADKSYEEKQSLINDISKDTLKDGLFPFFDREIKDDIDKRYNIADCIINLRGTSKDIAGAAYLIMTSKHFRNAPSGGWKGWYHNFCELVGCKAATYDNVNKIKEHTKDKKYDSLKFYLG